MKSQTLDTFTLEILRSFLISAVREMIVTTTRTAYSTCFAEGQDFTCGIFDAQGRMVAQDQGVPVHAGALGDAVLPIISNAGHISEGDVFIHNDPYTGATHQADGLVCRPIFAEGQLVGFAVNRGHWMDVGGMAPGGWSGTAADVFQEGLIIPGVRLLAAGRVVEDVRSMVLHNVRMPRQLWGDIQAQIASNVVAERRISQLIRRYGFEGFQEAVEATLDYSERRFSVALKAMPDGVADAQDFIEDDAWGNGPFKIRVRLMKWSDHVRVDFTGTDPQASAPVNSTLACTKAAVMTTLLAAADPDIPLNAGVLRLVTVIAPAGTLVNPVSPAPTFNATGDADDRVAETVMRALGQFAPGRVPAGSYATCNNTTGGSIDTSGRPVLWYSYQSGGCGARPDKDGNSAEWHVTCNAKNESMEVWETRYPVQFIAYRLLPNSGGAGKWRGGLGTERLFRIVAPTRLSGISDHHRTGAHGLAGGRPGRPNSFEIERNGVRRSLQETFGLLSPSKFSNLPLQPGDIFASIQGGGGGYGKSEERDPEGILADLRGGYITPESALRDYGFGIETSASNPAV